MLRTIAQVGVLLAIMQTNIFLATDWWYGERDPIGPYPRIPDKDLVKVTFTIVCLKFLNSCQFSPALFKSNFRIIAIEIEID